MRRRQGGRRVARLIAQSIAFVYAPGEGTRVETDPLDLAATGARKRTVDGVVALEDATLEMPEGIVLRYGLLYGPGTWFELEKRGKPALHVDAAAHAALLAVTQGQARHLQHRRRRWRDFEREGQARIRLRCRISDQVLNGLLRNCDPFSP